MKIPTPIGERASARTSISAVLGRSRHESVWGITIFAAVRILILYCNMFFFQALICLVDKKTGDKSKTRPRFVKQDQVAIMRIECAGIICLEPFKKFAQMGRFTLRDESKFFVIYTIFISSHCSTKLMKL